MTQAIGDSTLAIARPDDDANRSAPVRVPRPGHADLGGALLYDLDDIRDVIERASARETAAKVACGAVARLLLQRIGCSVFSHVVAIGGERAGERLDTDDLERVEADPVRCADPAASARMCVSIDEAAAAGDTLGGVVEILAVGYPPGVGSYVHGDRRLQSRLAAAVLSIPAIRGVEFGLGFEAAKLPGSAVHDALGHKAECGYTRGTNNAGGIEGGMSTGERHRPARRDEADSNASKSAAERRARNASLRGIALRAVGRLRGARRRGRSRGRRLSRARRWGSRALRRRDGHRARGGVARVPRALSATVSASTGQSSTTNPPSAVALVGFMGVGKSTIGRLAAASLSCPFVDSDVLVEQRHGDIAEIFAARGEQAFRQFERDEVCAALTAALERPSVVALGGGAVLSPEVRETLGRLRHVVWLTAPADVLWARVKTSAGRRPLASDEERFRRLLEERSALYATVATDAVMNDGGRPKSDVADEVAWIASASTGTGTVPAPGSAGHERATSRDPAGHEEASRAFTASRDYDVPRR